MSSEKSTNVRLQNLPSVALRVLGAIAPELAAGIAVRLFFRTPARRKANAIEDEILAKAKNTPLRFRGETVAAWTWGEGPRVLLVHGWGGSAAQLTPFVDPLLAAGYSVSAFDAPGHGRSPGNTLTIPMFARLIEKAAGGSIHAVIAHSFGGAATVYAGSQGLDARRAVLLAPPSTPEMWVDRFSEYLALTTDFRARLRRRIEAHTGMPISALTVKTIGPLFYTPALVIHDRADREVAWTAGAEVADSLSAASIMTTEGLGHRRILTDRSVLEAALRFIDVAVEDRTCTACGRAVTQRHQLCPQCLLGDELFDRSKRWAA